MNLRNVELELRGEVLTISKLIGSHWDSKRAIQQVQLSPESAAAFKRALSFMEASHG